MLFFNVLILCCAIASKDKNSAFAKGFLLPKQPQKLENVPKKEVLLMLSQKERFEEELLISASEEKRQLCDKMEEERASAKKTEPSTKKGQFCHNCDKLCEKLMRCSGCKAVAFCSSACQRESWKTHKTFCKEHQNNLKKLPLNEEPEEEKLRQQKSIRKKIGEEFTVEEFNDARSKLEAIARRNKRHAQFQDNDCRVTANVLISIFTGKPVNVIVEETEDFLQKAETNKMGNTVEDLGTALFTKGSEKKLVKISFRNDNKNNEDSHPKAQEIYYGPIWGQKKDIPGFIHDILIEKFTMNGKEKFRIYQSWGGQFSINQWLDESTGEIKNDFNRDNFNVARKKFGNAKALSEKEMREWFQLFKVIAEFTMKMKQKDYSNAWFQKMQSALEADTGDTFEFNHDEDFIEKFIPPLGEALREMLGWYYSAIIWQNDISFYVNTI